MPHVSLGELISLEGRRAAVTGGGRGIGEAIARRLAEAGACVLVLDRNADDAAAVSVSLRAAFGGDHDYSVVDVAEATEIDELAPTLEAMGGVDIWVNNAGIFPNVPLEELDVRAWNQVVDINLRGAYLCARLASGLMTRHGRGGVIVNIVSTAGFHARGAGLAHYVASKHGVIGLTKALAVELAPAIRVLGVAPVVTQTPGWAENITAYRDAGMGQRIDAIASSLPIRRHVVPDDIARVVLFCASDLASVMTGSVLLADGGDVAR